MNELNKFEDEIKTIEEATEIVKEAVFTAMHQLPAILECSFQSDEEDCGNYFVYFDIHLVHPENNIIKKHVLWITYKTEDDEYGIEYHTNDGDVGEITPSNIMTQLYFDLAFEDYDGEIELVK